MTSAMQLQPSPVQTIHFAGHSIWLKRDDLLHPDFSGNKARKFAYLLAQTDLAGKTLIGNGSAQANSLLSLAALAKLKGAKLDYYVQHLPQFLQLSPSGNYAHALSLGANIICLPPHVKGAQVEPYLQQWQQQHQPNAVLISEGGRMQEAEWGIAQLAQEIMAWAHQQGIKQLNLVLPSGTGTTALFLQKHLPFNVVTCPCVGDRDYLQQQFSALAPHLERYPEIIVPVKKHHFGKLYVEFISIWQQLVGQTKVEFELLYDPLAWLYVVPELIKREPKVPMLYLHQGGVLGNISMLARYQRKFPALFI